MVRASTQQPKNTTTRAVTPNADWDDRWSLHPPEPSPSKSIPPNGGAGSTRPQEAITSSHGGRCSPVLPTPKKTSIGPIRPTRKGRTRPKAVMGATARTVAHAVALGRAISRGTLDGLAEARATLGGLANAGLSTPAVVDTATGECVRVSVPVVRSIRRAFRSLGSAQNRQRETFPATLAFSRFRAVCWEGRLRDSEGRYSRRRRCDSPDCIRGSHRRRYERRHAHRVFDAFGMDWHELTTWEECIEAENKGRRLARVSVKRGDWHGRAVVNVAEELAAIRRRYEGRGFRHFSFRSDPKTRRERQRDYCATADASAEYLSMLGGTRYDYDHCKGRRFHVHSIIDGTSRASVMRARKAAKAEGWNIHTDAVIRDPLHLFNAAGYCLRDAVLKIDGEKVGPYRRVGGNTKRRRE